MAKSASVTWHAEPHACNATKRALRQPSSTVADFPSDAQRGTVIPVKSSVLAASPTCLRRIVLRFALNARVKSL